MAVPVLTYGSKSWIIKERDKSKLQAAEMRFLRRVKGCTRRDLIRNEDIRKELNIYNINEKVEDYEEKWKEHLSRMDNERIPALIQQYQPKGKRDIGRSRKILKLRRALLEKHPGKKIILQSDNAWPHSDRVTVEKIRTFGWKTLPQSLYSPDLAPSDYHLFGSVKEQLQGERHETLEDIRESSAEA
ncbi:hypothetical protein ANN_25992 [Periplaneta americana]|uniref:Uncharacterized protein n=1 Tax=Periplaneta americana TaxID=6978 RepID=A0ABQ8S4Q8_PERAM|nr:hypothetical protein ANN_25992 [Periplaneta americana]